VAFKVYLDASNDNLFLNLNGKSIVKFDRDGAQRVTDRMKKWADGFGQTDGTIVGLKGITRFVGADRYMTVLYNNMPILRMDHAQCLRFVNRIQAWIDEPKMKSVDKIIREMRNAERELKEYGGNLDASSTG